MLQVGETSKGKGKGALNLKGIVTWAGTPADPETIKEPNQNLLQNHLGLSASKPPSTMTAWEAEITVIATIQRMMMWNKITARGLVPPAQREISSLVPFGWGWGGGHATTFTLSVQDRALIS